MAKLHLTGADLLEIQAALDDDDDVDNAVSGCSRLTCLKNVAANPDQTMYNILTANVFYRPRTTFRGNWQGVAVCWSV